MHNWYRNYRISFTDFITRRWVWLIVLGQSGQTSELSAVTSPWDLRPTWIGGQRLRGRPRASVDGGGKGGAFLQGRGDRGAGCWGERVAFFPNPGSLVVLLHGC